MQESWGMGGVQLAGCVSRTPFHPHEKQLTKLFTPKGTKGEVQRQENFLTRLVDRTQKKIRLLMKYG